MKKNLIVALSILSFVFLAPMSYAENVKIGLIVKALGIGFFEAANKGAIEASINLGDAEVIYAGPESATAEGQIAVINALVAQGVDAIAISANDSQALVPALQNAQAQGIKVISWDSGVAKEARTMHLNPSSNSLIGRMNVKLAADALAKKGESSGEFAILSAAASATNQNIWIEEMKNSLGEFPQLTLVDTVYGDDVADKSYRETLALIQKYPDLDVIVAPTTVGILAASQAINQMGLTGKVYVTGLGLPSELASHIGTGEVHSFAIWNPIDLGYAATTIAYNLVKGNATDSAIEMGRMGTANLDENGEAAMADPFIYDASNVADFESIF